jgi:hypothetical protein
MIARKMEEDDCTTGRERTGEVKRHRGIPVKEGKTFGRMWPITRRQEALLWEGLKSVGLSWGVERCDCLCS